MSVQRLDVIDIFLILIYISFIKKHHIGHGTVGGGQQHSRPDTRLAHLSGERRAPPSTASDLHAYGGLRSPSLADERE
jgi:hypothetical protein